MSDQITKAVLGAIFLQMQEGTPLRRILTQQGMPDRITLQRYMRDNPDVRREYLAAKRQQGLNLKGNESLRIEAARRRHKYIEERAHAKTPSTEQ